MKKSGSLVGIILEKSANDLDGKYKFIYDGSSVVSDNNILYVITEEELSDEEIIRRFAGTYGFKEIVRSK